MGFVPAFRLVLDRVAETDDEVGIEPADLLDGRLEYGLDALAVRRPKVDIRDERDLFRMGRIHGNHIGSPGTVSDQVNGLRGRCIAIG